MNKKGMLLSTTIILLLTGLLIAGAAGAAHKFFSSRDNSAKLERITDIVTLVNDHPFSQGSQGEQFHQKQSLALKPTELFMFFSSGNKNILLKYTPISKKEKLKDYKLEFKKPEECEDKACVCYCKMASPPWKPSSSKTYLELFRMRFSNSPEEVFKCQKPKCQKINSENQEIFFKNSRGIDSEFVFNLKKIAEKREKKDVFTPIPMDIVILIQPIFEYYDDGNLFFSSKAGEDYNAFEQEQDYVMDLTNLFQWENGVVIGGTGVSQNKDEMEKHLLNAVSANIRIEKHSGYDGIIGVCLDEAGSCLFKKALGKSKKEKEISEKKKDYLEDFSTFEEALKISLENNVNEKLKDLYSDLTLNTKIDQSKASATTKELFKVLNAFFVNTKNNDFRPELKFISSDKDKTILEFYLDGELKGKSDFLQIHSPLDESGKPLDFRFSAVDPSKGELINKKGVRKKIQITTLQNTKLTFKLT